jgi:prephenate dehydrogenase
VAAGDVELWQQILLDNRGHVLKSLAQFEEVLTAFREALEGNQPDRLIQLLAAGKRIRDVVAN